MNYKTFEDFQNSLHAVVNNTLGDESSPIHEYIDYACTIIDDTVGCRQFLKAYCGRGVHDAHEGGLADHTVKVFTELINMVFSGNADQRYYQNIQDNVDMKALIIGCILHDIGKVHEYDGGNNNIYHYVTHLLFGVEMLGSMCADGIIDKYGKETYWRIISILGQHHGEFGERPQTVEAYLVHLADYQETKLQILEEALGSDLRPSADEHSLNWLLTNKYISFKLNVFGGIRD